MRAPEVTAVIQDSWGEMVESIRGLAPSLAEPDEILSPNDLWTPYSEEECLEARTFAGSFNEARIIINTLEIIANLKNKYPT